MFAFMVKYLGVSSIGMPNGIIAHVFQVIYSKEFSSDFPAISRYINVTGFENGVVSIVPSADSAISTLISDFLSCFSQFSNFKEEFQKAFKTNTEIKCFSFKFNGIPLEVTELTKPTELYVEYINSKNRQIAQNHQKADKNK